MTSDLFFWKDKRVLLTGHTGFKGTWMSLMLNALGAEVCGYSLPLSPYSFYSNAKVKIARHCEGDIADCKMLGRVIEEFRPEIIIHLASHSSLDGSMKIPEFILKTNLMGCLNVLEIARKATYIKSVVIVTSDKCYQNTETDQPYVEDSLLGAKDPYSTSKVCQELLTGCYIDTFFNDVNKNVGVATARASNVIGAGDYNISRLMPYLLESYLSGNTPQIRNPHAVRPWQYVLDVLYGYLLLARKLYETAGVTSAYNGAYNFGPGEDGFAEVDKIVKMVGRYFGNEIFIKKNNKDRIQNETKILKLDSSKAHEILNWQVKKTLEETIELTVDFVKREKKGVSSQNLCREQIENYLKGDRINCIKN